ncbi:hypothetical protein AAC387_Pa09g0692 [Persea americana]
MTSANMASDFSLDIHPTSAQVHVPTSCLRENARPSSLATVTPNEGFALASTSIAKQSDFDPPIQLSPFSHPPPTVATLVDMNDTEPTTVSSVTLPQSFAP